MESGAAQDQWLYRMVTRSTLKAPILGASVIFKIIAFFGADLMQVDLPPRIWQRAAPQLNQNIRAVVPSEICSNALSIFSAD